MKMMSFTEDLYGILSHHCGGIHCVLVDLKTRKWFYYVYSNHKFQLAKRTNVVTKRFAITKKSFYMFALVLCALVGFVSL